jgi:hypothetical protein
MRVVGGRTGIDPNDQGVQLNRNLSTLQFTPLLSWQQNSNMDAAHRTNPLRPILSWQHSSNRGGQ